MKYDLITAQSTNTFLPMMQIYLLLLITFGLIILIPNNIVSVNYKDYNTFNTTLQAIRRLLGGREVGGEGRGEQGSRMASLLTIDTYNRGSQ